MDSETGEVTEGWDPTVKWQLQVVSRQLLQADHRVRICHRHRRPEWQEVQVRAGERFPYYAGLMACGLLWVCPVCAAKVQAYRADELRRALSYWTVGGGGVELATFTVPHGRRDDLGDVLRELLKAYERMCASRAYGKLADEAGNGGTVRGLEVTWNERHGWHPHLHVLQLWERVNYSETDVCPDRAQRLFAMWHRSVLNHTRRGAPDRRAFRLQDAAHAARYVTKLGTEYLWTTEDELVRSHSKRGRGDSRSPFDLLRAHAEGVKGPWKALWREYEAAFKGRSQLQWSKGLKRLLLAHEGPTDQEVADSIGRNDAILASITGDEWALIRKHELRGAVLQVVHLHGAEGLRHLLDGLTHA